jgi:alpha-1,2-mannosyltransferase
MAHGGAVRLLRRPVPAGWPSLPLALALVATAGAALVRAVVDGRFLWQHPTSNDFGEYYLAGRIGLAQGWPAVYDVHTYVAAARAFLGFPDAFANLPVVAWLAAPLTALPYRLALGLWLLTLAGAVVWVWRTAVPTGGLASRVAHLTAWLATFPLAFAFLLGQLCVAVIALVILHWWLLRTGRAVAAGVALGLACVKPQMVFLVPVALVASRQWRAAAACGVTVLALGGLCLLLLWPHGVAAYRESVGVELSTRFDALAAQLPAGFPMPPLQLVIACLALVPALAGGGRSAEPALAAAIAGSLLATPYLNPEDSAILVPCAWLVLRARPTRWVGPALLLSYPAVALRNVTGPGPVLAVEAFWVAALAFESMRRRVPQPV